MLTPSPIWLKWEAQLPLDLFNRYKNIKNKNNDKRVKINKYIKIKITKQK